VETAVAETQQNEDLGENLFLLSFQTAQVFKYLVPEEPLRSRYCCVGLHGCTAHTIIASCVTEWKESLSCPGSETRLTERYLGKEKKEDSILIVLSLEGN